MSSNQIAWGARVMRFPPIWFDLFEEKKLNRNVQFLSIHILSTWQFLHLPHRYRKNQIERFKTSNVCQITRSTIHWNLIDFFCCCCNENRTVCEFDKEFYAINWTHWKKGTTRHNTYKNKKEMTKSGHKILWNWWQ